MTATEALGMVWYGMAWYGMVWYGMAPGINRKMTTDRLQELRRHHHR